MMILTREHAVKVLEVVDQGLSCGLGSPVPGQMCVEAAVCYALDLPHGDDPQCVGQAVRRYKIGLNDGFPGTKMERAKILRKIAIAQLGSNTIDQSKFAQILSEKLIRRILPIALRAVGLTGVALWCENEGTREAASAADAAASAARAAHAASASAADAAAHAASAADAKIWQLAADIGIEALQECGSPGCEWLDLVE